MTKPFGFQLTQERLTLNVSWTWTERTLGQRGDLPSPRGQGLSATVRSAVAPNLDSLNSDVEQRNSERFTSPDDRVAAPDTWLTGMRMCRKTHPEVEQPWQKPPGRRRAPPWAAHAGPWQGGPPAHCALGPLLPEEASGFARTMGLPESAEPRCSTTSFQRSCASGRGKSNISSKRRRGQLGLGSWTAWEAISGDRAAGLGDI